jgi:hypothetical protein
MWFASNRAGPVWLIRTLATTVWMKDGYVELQRPRNVESQDIDEVQGTEHGFSQRIHGLTIARYSAAVFSGLRDATGCGRGGIAGRWTKPVAAFPGGGAPSKAESLARTRLGELYPGSTDATSVNSSW